MLKRELNFKISFLQVNIVLPDEIININNEYLNHNYSTDVLTFDYSGNKNDIDGEIFISLKDAEINSRRYKVKVDEEIIRLVIHGILHLSGYDDKQPENRILMKKRENELLKKCKKLIKK